MTATLDPWTHYVCMRDMIIMFSGIIGEIQWAQCLNERNIIWRFARSIDQCLKLTFLSRDLEIVQTIFIYILYRIVHFYIWYNPLLTDQNLCSIAAFYIENRNISRNLAEVPSALIGLDGINGEYWPIGTVFFMNEPFLM